MLNIMNTMCDVYMIDMVSTVHDMKSVDMVSTVHEVRRHGEHSEHALICL